MIGHKRINHFPLLLGGKETLSIDPVTDVNDRSLDALILAAE